MKSLLVCMAVCLFALPACHFAHTPHAAPSAQQQQQQQPCFNQDPPTTPIYGYGPGWQMYHLRQQQLFQQQQQQQQQQQRQPRR